MKQQRPFEEGFHRAGDLHEAGSLHHTQCHRILPTGRHLNFALHFKTFINFLLNLKTFVRVLVQGPDMPPRDVCREMPPRDVSKSSAPPQATG